MVTALLTVLILKHNETLVFNYLNITLYGLYGVGLNSCVNINGGQKLIRMSVREMDIDHKSGYRPFLCPRPPNTGSKIP